MIRIFVGCSPNNEDLESQSVLEYSLRKHHAADDISIEWMQLSRDSSSFWYSRPHRGQGWNSAGWATPFSAFRWAVPARCDFEGKAIYMDSDMIVMADISELWEQKFRGNAAVISKARNNRYCVSLFDCERMQKHVPSLHELKTIPHAYQLARGRANAVVQVFEGNWNCCDGEHYASLRDPDIKILHYTDIPTQLHLKYSLPRIKKEGGKHWFTGQPRPHPRADFQKLFDGLLAGAIENGYPPEKYRKEPFGDYATRWAA